MTKLYLLLAMFGLAIFSSCSQNEVANEVLPTATEEASTTIVEDDQDLEEGKAEFTIDNQDSQVLEKDALILTNSSVNAVSYLWDFGNGHTSTEANPTYAYGNHGEFTVSLTITDKNGTTQEASQHITVICLFDGRDHSDF